MSKTQQVVCPLCHATNRIAIDRIGDEPACGSCGKLLLDGEPLELTAESFDRHIDNSDWPVLVDFWAPWCGPCRAISPIVEELSEEFKGRVDVFKCDVDENSDIVAEYGVRNIPTLIFIKEGKLVDKLVGATTKSAIIEKINSLL